MDPTNTHRKMFIVAAAFNLIVSATLLKPSLMFDLLGVTPVPAEDFVLHVLCVVIAWFGVGYYWASKNFEANAQIVRLGMVAKASVFSLAVLDVALGVISWQSLLLASGDLVFAILFRNALKDLDAAKKR